MIFWVYWTHDSLFIKSHVCVALPHARASAARDDIRFMHRYLHHCEFFLEIDGAVALQFTAADLCGLTNKGLLHPFLPPFTEFAGTKDHWYASGSVFAGFTDVTLSHVSGSRAAGCICRWFFKAAFACTSCDTTTSILALDHWGVIT